MTTELEDLKKRVAELENAAKPPEPFVPMPMPRRDLTEGASMSKEAMLRMAAVDTSGLAADLRAFQQQQQRAASSPAEPQRPRGTGWIEPRPLESPPGVALADRLVDAQDKIDRAELIERELKLAQMGKGK